MFASLLLAGLVGAGELTSRCLNLLALTCILNEDRLLRGRQLTSDARSTGLRVRPKSPQFGHLPVQLEELSAGENNTKGSKQRKRKFRI